MTAASSTSIRRMIICAAIAAGVALPAYFIRRSHLHSTQTVADIEQLVQDHPRDVNARLKLGTALFAQHRFSKAEETCKAAAALAPSDTRPLNILARIAAAQNHDTDAVKYLHASLKINQDDPSVWRIYGIVLEKHDPQAAWQALCQAVTVDNSESAAWLRSGVQAMKQKENHRGMHDIQRAADLNPEDLLAQVELGAVARVNSEPTIAARAYDKALSISADCVPALVGSAAVTLQVDPSPAGLARAKKQLDYVIGFAPSPDAYLTRGHLNLLERRYQAALSDLQTTLKMDPRVMDAHSMLYQCYAALGQQRLAHAELSIFTVNAANAASRDRSGIAQ
jgi:Tfp pilus assembly protein PilF